MRPFSLQKVIVFTRKNASQEVILYTPLEREPFAPAALRVSIV
jgi:hypothetical protein